MKIHGREQKKIKKKKSLSWQKGIYSPKLQTGRYGGNAQKKKEKTNQNDANPLHQSNQNEQSSQGT
jgi:hypothetical protein